MKPDPLEQKLIAAARRAPSSERVPHLFEKRIMARLAMVQDPWAQWSRSLWRAAFACSAIALLFGLWGFLPTAPAESPDLAAQLENSIYASASAGLEELW